MIYPFTLIILIWIYKKDPKNLILFSVFICMQNIQKLCVLMPW